MFAQVGRGGDAWIRKEVGFSDLVSELSFGSSTDGLVDSLNSLLDHTVGSTLTPRSFHVPPLPSCCCCPSSIEHYQRTRESARRFKEGMGLSTSLPPPGGLQTPRSIIWQLSGGILPEPNRRLLAFYNICAEYKKAIFQVFKPKPWLNNETTFFRERKQRRT